MHIISTASHFARVYWCGLEGQSAMLAMERLGASLDEVFNFCGRKFSLSTVARLADQMVIALECVVIFTLI